MERYERADLALLARKRTSGSIRGFSRNDSDNDVEMSVERGRSAVYGALSTFETSTFGSGVAGLMNARAGQALPSIEKREEAKSQLVTEPGRTVTVLEYITRSNELKDGDDGPEWAYLSEDDAEEDEDQGNIDKYTQYEHTEHEDMEDEDKEDEDMEGEFTDALRADLDSKMIVQSAQNLSSLNTALEENTGIHVLGRYHVHELLASSAKKDSIFINCTISEDRSGDQESVTSMRLAALSLRGNVELHVPINDSSNGNSQIQPPSDTNSKRNTRHSRGATEVSSTRLYLGNLARNGKFPFKPDSQLGQNSHADFGVATKSDVEAHFSSHPGEIVEIKLMNGFGFIEYRDAFDARDAIPGI